MADVIKRKLDETIGDVKLAIQVESPAHIPTGHIITKAMDFLNWALAPNQMKLDLSTSNQVILNDVTLNADKPVKGAKKYGISMTGNSNLEDQSTLYNLHQTGKTVTVIIREQPAKKTPETKDKKDKSSKSH